MSKKSIHALLIAINDYTDGIRPLNGCLNDMHAFRDYLAKQCKGDEFDFTPSVLENAQATRQAIVDGFQHFQSAKAGDVCVMYFSGHGSRIDTTDFWEAHDGKNEAIVCYDTCLADKELSCLIYEATKNKPDVHFLAVMDCCHSGGNTRFDDGTVARMSKPNRYPFSIADYYGYNENLYIQNEEGKYSAPKGRHIQFGACRNYETAKETIIGVDFRGAFTSSLIETLDTTNDVLSYTDLERRIIQKIENRVANQRPQLDAINGARMDTPFLGGAILPKNRYFVSWNKMKNTWEVNAGIYHGISDGLKPSKILSINRDTEGIKFSIDKIFADRTSLSVSGNIDLLDRKKQYNVHVEVGGGQARKVAYSPDGDTKTKELLETYYPKAQTSYIKFTENLDEADFFIHAYPHEIWLRQKGEDNPTFYPITSMTISMFHAVDFWHKVDAVLQWFHLKSLDNPVTSIQPTDIDIQLFRKTGVYAWWQVPLSSMEKIDDWHKPTLFPYQLDKSGQNVPACFAMKITNKGNQDLFVSALFMDGRFGINNGYLPIEKLAPNNEVWLSYTQGSITTKSLGLGIDNDHYTAGLTEQMDYIKLMVATQDFDTNAFFQESLNIKGTKSAMRGDSATKGIMMIPTIQQFDWTAFLVGLHLVRS